MMMVYYINAQTVQISYCRISAIVCPYLDEIPHGDVKQKDINKAGCTALYTCDKGFKLVGDALRKCQYDGSWSRKAPVCKSMWHANDASRTFCMTVIYCNCTTCNILFTPHIIGIVCSHLDHIQYGKVKVDRYYPSSVAYYSCNDGYELVGSASRKCLDDGSWYGKAPICRKSKWPCWLLESCLLHFRTQELFALILITQNMAKLGLTATIHHHRLTTAVMMAMTFMAYPPGNVCLTARGMERLQSVVRVSPHVCDIFSIFTMEIFSIHTGIVCPHLDHPQYGRVKVDSYSPSSRAHYSCDDGYALYGLTYRKCLADGSWYGKAPICRKSKSCMFVSIFSQFSQLNSSLHIQGLFVHILTIHSMAELRWTATLLHQELITAAMMDTPFMV